MRIYSKDSILDLEQEEQQILRKMEQMRERLEAIRVEKDNITNLPFAEKLISRETFLMEFIQHLPASVRNVMKEHQQKLNTLAGVDMVRIGAENTSYKNLPVVLEMTIPQIYESSLHKSDCYLFRSEGDYLIYRIPIEASLTKQYAKQLASDFTGTEHDEPER